MAQPPFKTDVLQVEPGAAGTRTVSRDSTTGGLKFVDPAFPAGVLLADLVGLQTVDGVSLVGVGGGAQYTSIQDALDAIPLTSSISAPTAVLIFSGVYTEDLTISKDGVILVGLGYVKITNATATSTIHITEDADSIPKFVQLKNLTIENTAIGEECVFVDGSNTFASGTVLVNTAPLAVGDLVTIGGVPLTGVAGARTSGSDNFNASLLTVAALAAEIAAAINDVANSFVGTVTASALGATVTILAATPGAGGNAITLTVTTTPGGGMTASGATLTGGGGLDSEVGVDEVAILDCDLLATGVGTRQIVTETMNNVRVHGGTWFGSSSSSACIVAQTASFKLSGVEWINDVQAAYDTGNDQPIVTTSEFQITGCGRTNDLLINFIGAGSTLLANVPVVGDVTHNGDRSFTAMNCEMGAVLVEDTVTARFVNCTRDSIGGAGTPTLAESTQTLSSVLAGAGSDAVVFARPQPDAVYAVFADVPTAGVITNVTTKTASGFTATFSAPVTGTVFYTIVRQM